MESNVNHFSSFKLKLKNLYLVINSVLKDFLQLARENKANIFFLILFLLTPLAYEVLDIFVNIKSYDAYLKTSKKYLVLSDYITYNAQKAFGILFLHKNFVSIFTAYFYTFGFTALSVIAFVMLVVTLMRKREYRRREPYVYISILIIMFIIDIAGYVFFPTAPPVRLFKDLFYRAAIFPGGDKLVILKYNSIPSGHIYALTVPFIVAKAENYKRWTYLFGGGLVFTSWVVLLTGDHYAIDIFSAYFLCIILFAIFTTAYDYFNKNSAKVSKSVMLKRVRSLAITLISLILLTIITLAPHGSLFFIFQVICILVIWPIVVFTTNTDGLINGDGAINRSLFIDFIDGLKAIRDSFKKSLASIPKVQNEPSD